MSFRFIASKPRPLHMGMHSFHLHYYVSKKLLLLRRARWRACLIRWATRSNTHESDEKGGGEGNRPEPGRGEKAGNATLPLASILPSQRPPQWRGSDLGHHPYGIDSVRMHGVHFHTGEAPLGRVFDVWLGVGLASQICKRNLTCVLRPSRRACSERGGGAQGPAGRASARGGASGWRSSRCWRR